MRAAVTVLTILCVPAFVLAQAPAATPPPAKTPQTTQPPTPAPARPRPQAAATAVLTVAVNDSGGAPIADVKVGVLGPVEREGVTTAAGEARMLGIRPGTYRLRFEKEGFYTFEKEVTWRAGTPAPTVVEATLTAAPPPPPPPPPEPEPPPKPAFVADLPPGKPSNLDVPEYIERNHISNKEPHKENLIGCSGGAQSWLWQVREPWQNRQHESAELMLYVVGGEGTLAINGRDVALAAGTLAVVPRGTSYGLTRRGRAPAIYILATLSGPPCAQ
jgi:mannose-6-phosphate isomerase-like protein (cupin superfamily)